MDEAHPGSVPVRDRRANALDWVVEGVFAGSPQARPIVTAAFCGYGSVNRIESISSPGNRKQLAKILPYGKELKREVSTGRLL